MEHLARHIDLSLGELDACEGSVVIENPDRARTDRQCVGRDARDVDERPNLARLRIEQRQLPRSFARSPVVAEEPQTSLVGDEQLRSQGIRQLHNVIQKPAEHRLY